MALLRHAASTPSPCGTPRPLPSTLHRCSAKRPQTPPIPQGQTTPRAGVELDAGLDAVATAFAAVSPYFRAYADYCSRYFAAIETLKALRGRRRKLRERLVELQSAHGLPIESLLIKPSALRTSQLGTFVTA